MDSGRHGCASSQPTVCSDWPTVGSIVGGTAATANCSADCAASTNWTDPAAGCSSRSPVFSGSSSPAGCSPNPTGSNWPVPARRCGPEQPNWPPCAIGSSTCRRHRLSQGRERRCENNRSRSLGLKARRFLRPGIAAHVLIAYASRCGRLTRALACSSPTKSSFSGSHRQLAFQQHGRGCTGGTT